MESAYNYNYQGDYSDILTLDDNKKRTFINAICITQSIKHASLELGKAENSVYAFLEENDIDADHIKLMRKRFALSETKIKLQYISNGKKSYSKNPKFKN